jgi:transcription initiation factor IIE alpha subunit
MALGNCDGVLDLLDRSESIQGRRKEIDRLRSQADKSC